MSRRQSHPRIVAGLANSAGRLTALCAASLLIAIGCENRPEHRARPTTTLDKSSIPAIYRPLFEGGLGFAEVDSLRASLPYKSITLSRSPCFGDCPVYDVTLRSDGKATLKSNQYLDEIGTFEGEVNIFSYGKLCYLMDRLEFSKFQPQYEANWTDATTVTITASTKDCEITVSDYSEIGPVELWAIQQTIDNIRHEIEWKRVDDAEMPAAK